MNEDIKRKRAILLTTKLRFSSDVQPKKESAIDKIIEQILPFDENKIGLTLHEIKNIIYSESGSHILDNEIINSLARLIERERIVSERDGKNNIFYKLSEETYLEVEKIKQQAEDTFNSIVRRLFKNVKEGYKAYFDPFLEFLCIVFSSLGDEYVKILTGAFKKSDLLTGASFSLALKKIKENFPLIDHPLFEDAVITFFRDSDPDYDTVKWNMAQNYYIAKVLGMDPDGVLLSKEIFSKAVFYLDTNIIISALEPKDIYHESFLVFKDACKQLGIELKICQVSLDELYCVIEFQRELLEKVGNQISDELATKVDSVFYQIYSEKKKSKETFNFDDVFINFNSPKDDLKDKFNVGLEDDQWFYEAKKSPKVISFAKDLKIRHSKMKGKQWKRDNAAIHDAILLFWLQELRRENNNIWLITLDSSLPGAIPVTQNENSRSLAITLDLVLQWISPIVAQEGREVDFSEIYGKMIRSRFLPQEKIFDLQDFLIFHQVGIECKELPSEDVEKSIRYIKNELPTLDPSKPVDREKLVYELRKFFVSPGRKYKQQLENLEKENEMLKSQIANIIAYKQKISTWVRITLTLFLFFIIEGIIVYCTSIYGQGENLFQKLLNSWYFLAIGSVITIILGWFIVGKERLKNLGFPFTKIFKIIENDKKDDNK